MHGVGMIGYYNRPGEFPVKNATRVDMELNTMIKNGCTRIQVCGAKDVINNKEIAEVFRKHFKQYKEKRTKSIQRTEYRR